jgi:enoyl-[acyl-carrier protein] reductase I
MQMTGKKGLVVGVANSHSIAWGCVKSLHDAGAQVVASCLNDKAYEFVSPLTNPLGVPLLKCNVDNEQELDQLVQQAVDQLGKLDFVIHSIAWAPLNELHGKVSETSREGFAKAMDISCHSFASLAKLCAPHMREGGSLVTMTYIGADTVVPHYGIMGPIKAALESMVRYMAVELGEKGIRVHAVSPGPIPTRAASGIEDFDELMTHATQIAPLKRLVTLDEVANLCVFLCSDLSGGMTGQTIFVDAGYHVVS